VPTSKQRRQAAQRHLQKQLERRSELAKRRRRNLGIVATLVAVAVVVVAALVITGVFSSDSSSSNAAGSSSNSATAASTSSAAPTTNADGTITCTYSPDKSGNTNLKDVGTPPKPEATPTQGTATLLMKTSQGDLTLTLDRTKAPCAAASFAYLAQKKFFDGSPCHREVNEPTFGVLQCGDPTGSGSGGPTYKFAQEVPAGTTYPRGTIAMANTGQPNSTGSQFFLCFTDTQLSPDYSPVGTVDAAGLAVLDKIAAAGNNGSFASQAGGGAPNTPVTIKEMTVVG
jgi:peptidyl-prolyl cis-trans isomerase B (cyclophilin B)